MATQPRVPSRGTERGSPSGGNERAALAFSLLASRPADQLVQRLTAIERARLREGLARVHDASDTARRAALHALYQESRRGIEFPIPTSHDEATCPFHKLERFPIDVVTQVLERVAKRNPIHVALALCHVTQAWREDTWPRLNNESRSAILATLRDVPTISKVQTREVARDLDSRLGQSVKTMARIGR